MILFIVLMIVMCALIYKRNGNRPFKRSIYDSPNKNNLFMRDKRADMIVVPHFPVHGNVKGRN